MSTTQEKDPSRASAGRAVQHKSVAPAVHYPFWFGGSASGMAACVTHPLDLGMSSSSTAVSMC